MPYSRREVTVYSEGITNIIDGIHNHGIARLVCVSSTSVATDEVPGESLVWRKAVVPLLRNVIGRTLYNDMQLMEETVRGSSVDWTIVRPGGLFNTADPTGDYGVSARRFNGRMTSRADLARALIVEATQPRYPRSAIEVITRSQLPSFRTFVREAFGIRA